MKKISKELKEQANIYIYIYIYIKSYHYQINKTNHIINKILVIYAEKNLVLVTKNIINSKIV